MRTCVTLGIAIQLAYAAYLAVSLAYRLDLFTPYALNEDGYPYLMSSSDVPNSNVPSKLQIKNRVSTCSRVHNMIARNGSTVRVEHTGFEDLAWLSPTAALSCAGNLWGTFEGDVDPDALAFSTCVVIVVPSSNSESGSSDLLLYEVAIEGFPADTAFRSHGIYVLPISPANPEQQRVFVVNHAYNRGGERIDVFDYEPKTKTLHHVDYIADRVIQRVAMGVLNDVVAISASDVYATVAFAPVETFQPTAWERFKHRLLAHAELVLDARARHLLHCRKSTGVADASWHCRVAASHFGMANGISIDPEWQRRPGIERPILFVNDLTSHTLVFLSVDLSSGSVSRLGSHWLLNAVDNIEFDRFGEVHRDKEPHRYVFTAGTIYSMLEASKTLEHRDAVARGGVTLLDIEVAETRPGKGTSSTAMVTRFDEALVAAHNGIGFSGTSSGIVLWKQPPEDSARAVMGSYANHGLTVCDVIIV